MAEVTELTTTADAEAMLAASHDRPIALLKHSSMCFASMRGRAAFEQLDGELPLYTVVVQRARAVSSWLEERLGVRHETPQAIVLKDGRPVLVQNHGRIRPDDLLDAARTAARDAA
jgi:bacillithiol system protein YtxJ